MKALKSELAKKVLADPSAREQLRDVVAGEYRNRGNEASRGVIVLHDSRGRVHRRLTAAVVPKAA